MGKHLSAAGWMGGSVDKNRKQVRMPSKPVVRESRRSTRVSMQVMIEARGLTEPLACNGETQVVNLHGALISTAVALRVGMEVEIHVILTDERASAQGCLRRSRPTPALRNCATANTQYLGVIFATRRLAGRSSTVTSPSGPGESIIASNLQNRCR
jgi:hypothetical protein